MGYKAVSAVMHHSQAKGTALLVALAIAHYHDDRAETSGAWPTQELLAERARVSVRSVQRAINELVELGELEVVVHGGLGRTYDRQTNRYFVILDCPQGCDGSFNHRSRDDIQGAPTRQPRLTNTTNWVDQHDNGVVLTVKNNLRTLKAVI